MYFVVIADVPFLETWMVVVVRNILDGRRYLPRSTVVSGRGDGMFYFAARNLLL